jgi:hypothetical protein
MADTSSFLVPILREMTFGVDAWKKPAKVVATSNVALVGLQTVDGVALAAGDEVLCVGQSSGAQNGVWVAAAAAWARRSDTTNSERLFAGVRVPITHGTAGAGSVYRLATTGKINVGTTAQAWELDSQGADGSPEAVAPTPDTLALRGADGEVRAEWIETSTMRTTSGGDAVFAEGSTTFARIRSTNAPAQIGDIHIDPATGEPYTYISGRGAVALREWRVRVPRFTPDAAAGDTVEIPISGPPGVPWTITSAKYIANDILFADASNYAVLRVRVNDGGSFLGNAAVGNTTPSGTNSTGDWVPYADVNLTLQSALLAFPFASTDRIAFSIGKVGTGVIVPAGVLEVVCVPWQDA